MSQIPTASEHAGSETAIADRPLRRENLKALEEADVEVTLRRGYSFPSDDQKHPHVEPRKIRMSFKKAFAHKAKFQEAEKLIAKKKEIERERQIRRGERDLDPDKPKPGAE